MTGACESYPSLDMDEMCEYALGCFSYYFAFYVLLFDFDSDEMF